MTLTGDIPVSFLSFEDIALLFMTVMQCFYGGSGGFMNKMNFVAPLIDSANEE